MQSIHVLLVEDDEDDFIITRDFLNDIDHTDYRLEWINNPEDAVSRLINQNTDIDVCLLDYRLGATTGFEIIRKVMSKGVNVPMILLTEHSDKEIDLTAMQVGASDFLVKSEINSRLLDRTIRYVSAVKRHERERTAFSLEVEARRQAEAVNRSKDEFLGIISHELRGPLNAILLWTELLKTVDADPETIKTAAETIEHSVKQQNKILNDLIDLTKGKNNLIKLYPVKVNIKDMMHIIVQTHQITANEKQILMSLTACDDDLLLMADPDRLQQIFNNLLCNAIKFTPMTGQINISLTRQIEVGNPVAEIRIADNGIGIAPELLPFVFDRYLQAPTHSYSRNVGLGLGLTIAKNLVELHGGSIKAESRGLGQGSSFIVKLPVNLK